MKGLSETIIIVITAVVILVAALVLLVIFQGPAGNLGDFASARMYCNQQYTAKCLVERDSVISGWADKKMTVRVGGEVKACYDITGCSCDKNGVALCNS